MLRVLLLLLHCLLPRTMSIVSQFLWVRDSGGTAERYLEDLKAGSWSHLKGKGRYQMSAETPVAFLGGLGFLVT